MTKEEFKKKISEVMDEAIKIDTVKSIVEDMDKTMNRDDLSDTARDALVIGYSEMLHKTYEKIRFIWLHLYDLRKDVEGICKLIDTLEKGVLEETADVEEDLPFVTPTEEVEA